MFDLQPTLTGRLLQLRPLRESDFESLYGIACDPLLWDQHPDKGRGTRKGFTQFFAQALASKGTLVAITQADDLVIGCSRFHGYQPEHSWVTIGYTFLARSHWGGTYNTEMKRLMLGYAFRFVENVRFLIAEQNIRSQRAVAKLGAMQVDSEVHTELKIVHLIYQLTREQYQRTLAK